VLAARDYQPEAVHWCAVKTRDDRVELGPDASHIAVTESGHCWVAFARRSYLSLFDRDCNEVARTFVSGRITAIDALEDGSIAVLCGRPRDVWGQRSGGDTVHVLAPDGAARSRTEFAGGYSTTILAESATLFHLCALTAVRRADTSGAVTTRALGVDSTFTRDLRNREPWACNRWQAQPVSDPPWYVPTTGNERIISRLVAGHTPLGIALIEDGAWGTFRSARLGRAYVLMRLGRVARAPAYEQPAAVACETILPAECTHLAATLDNGAWIFSRDQRALRVDRAANSVRTIELAEPGSDTRAFAISDSGREIAALLATREGCVLRRATVE
jgi:hypothetical protein